MSDSNRTPNIAFTYIDREQVNNKYRLMLVDDHRLFRDSIKFLLLNSGNIDVIAEASDGLEFLRLVEDVEPDLVLMDIAMPNMDGIEATKLAVSNNPEMKIIVLSMFGERHYYHEMLQAGAKGFILKESGSEELMNAIHTVMEGDFYFSKEIINSMIKNISTKTHPKESPLVKQELSNREIEILKLICYGIPNSEIAKSLSISQRTVEGHRSKILKKAKAKNSIHLLLFAINNKLIDI
ncbi:MAG: response regulator transcription factor [Bacteroidetes bacterium]|nr:response regulator transcription factor [Bacteroidota bacterium]